MTNSDLITGLDAALEGRYRIEHELSDGAMARRVRRSLLIMGSLLLLLRR